MTELATCPPFPIYLWQDVDGYHEPGCRIHRSWPCTKRARSSHSQRCEGTNKTGGAHGSCTVPLSMLGFICVRMERRFDRTTPTKNSRILRCELAPFHCILFSKSRIGHEFCRSGLEQCPGYLFCNLGSVTVIRLGRYRGCYLTPFSGSSSGSIVEYAFKRQIRFRKCERPS